MRLFFVLILSYSSDKINTKYEGGIRMKFMVGLQFANKAFTDFIIENKEHINEVYFSWSDFPNGRSNQLMDSDLLPWQMQRLQTDTLELLNNSGIKMNVLFNANCYGAQSLSWHLFEKVGKTVDFLKNRYSLTSVTTTSPLIAKFVKANFNDIELRASVNMEIGSTEGMEYLLDYFDSFYLKRELNRDLDKISELSDFAASNGKKLYALANSGCLNNCSAHNFHDNLVAHEAEISQMNNAYEFNGICKEFLKKEENLKKLAQYTNFIRPEDISKYDTLFYAVKLATRVHKNPETVLKSYINQKYAGNILDILEPAHSIYPYVLENGEPLRLVKLDDAFMYK